MGRNLALGAVLAVLAGCSAAPDPVTWAALEQSAAQANENPAPSGELAAGPARDENGAETRTDSAQASGYWLVMAPPAGGPAKGDGNSDWPAASASAPATGPAEEMVQTADGMSYVPWQHRQGPAYPGNFWYSFGRWGKEMPETLWDDTKATFTNPWTWVGLGAAGAAGITINASHADDKVANFYTKHDSQLNSFWDTVGDAGGNPGTHFAVAGAMYFVSLARDDKPNYDKSTTLINALILTDLTTVALKIATRTRSPNGDELGWPSGHTSSSFAFATVIWEEYGPWAGAPLMAFAGYVGYERIDARNHDFSDVISGAILGVAIAHAVTQNHPPRIMGFDVVPYVSPSNGAVGVAATKRW
jgi:membrane-associated phospholipid phosphatase